MPEQTPKDRSIKEILLQAFDPAEANDIIAGSIKNLRAKGYNSRQLSEAFGMDLYSNAEKAEGAMANYFGEGVLNPARFIERAVTSPLSLFRGKQEPTIPTKEQLVQDWEATTGQSPPDRPNAGNRLYLKYAICPWIGGNGWIRNTSFWA